MRGDAAASPCALMSTGGASRRAVAQVGAAGAAAPAILVRDPGATAPSVMVRAGGPPTPLFLWRNAWMVGRRRP